MNILANTVNQSRSSLVLPPIHEDLSDSRARRNTADVCICYFPGRQSARIPYRIHYGFTGYEQIIIKEALKIVSKRLFKHRILDNMYEHCGEKGFCFGLDVWQRSNLSQHSTNHGAHYLLEYQLRSLQLKNEINQFPIVNIYPIYEENDISGRGYLSSVSCISHSSQSSVQGQFQIYLNCYQLKTTLTNKSHLLSWAGIIVHEMLHNLGHNHHVGDYTNRWQINLFTKCFEYNGKYSN